MPETQTKAPDRSAIVYSVIVPAFNEEDWLEKSLSALAEAMDTIDLPGEVIVVDNNSTDATPDIARRHGARVVFEPLNQISRARNAGAAQAAGRYLVFLDADTILPVAVLQTAIKNLESGTCCGGGVAVGFDKPIGFFAHNLMRLWNTAATRFDLAAGCFGYCLRQGHEDVGGFSERVYASEEIWFYRRLSWWGRKQGLQFRLITDPPVVTSSRKLEQPWGVFFTLLLVLVFPVAVLFRPLCWMWYRRPKNSGK